MFCEDECQTKAKPIMRIFILKLQKTEEQRLSKGSALGV